MSSRDGRSESTDKAQVGLDGEMTPGSAGKRMRSAPRQAARAPAGAGGSGPTIHDAATAAVEGKGSGAPVDAGVAARVGGHLGADFSAVRVHDDPLTQAATQAMGARAFAYGSDVFLGPGEHGGDLGLMAHELTHVAQQGAAGQRAPQRAVQVGDAGTPAEQEADRVSADVTGGARPAALIVDDGPVAPGQMLKSEFIATLRAQVTAAADEELGILGSAIGCPYIDQYFARYGTQPAAAGEALLRRFAPASAGVRTAAEMMPAVVARVREGVRTWRETGQPPADPGVEAPAAAAGPVAAPALRAPDGRETLASLEADLGPGQALDGATASRMSSALGADLGGVRIHAGAVAARKAADAGAVAFAAGSNVVLGASAPVAGTLEGDALLAHELAHTAQQAGAATDPVARRQAIGGEDATAESGADAAAIAAMAELHGGEKASLTQRLGAAFQTKLQLQRCEDPVKTPALDKIVANATVAAALETAWNESNPNAPNVPRGTAGSTKQEQGGWVVWNPKTDTYSIIRVPAGTRDGIEPGPKPAATDTAIVVAAFHTHPNTRAEGYSPDPSPPDEAYVKNVQKCPEIIRTHEGIKTIPYP